MLVECVGAKQQRKPERKCLGCGAKREKSELLRTVRSPQGEIYLDLSGKDDGRGAYICKNIECFTKAKKRKGFERAFKSAMPEAVCNALESLMKEEVRGS